MKKIKGFTLAEVLITLAIIGVVAALTIPSVVVNHQKQAYYTGFMKAYNILNNAYRMAEAENGPISNWTEGDFTNLTSKLKIAYTCSNNEECNNTNFNDFYKTKEIGNIVSFPLNIVDTNDINFLDDGSIIYPFTTTYTGEALRIFVDTNGLKKPNFVGKDVFLFILANKNNSFILFPYGSCYTTGDGLECNNDRITKEECTNTNSLNCGALLLKDRKMDYDL